MMSRIIGISALVGALVSLAMALQLQPDILRLELPASVELGLLRPAVTHPFEIDVGNPSRYPVEVLSITSSCPCASAVMPDPVIGPEQFRKILVEVHPSENGAHATLTIAFHIVGASRVGSQRVKILASGLPTSD